MNVLSRLRSIGLLMLRKLSEPTSWAGIALAAPVLAPHAPASWVPFIGWGGPVLAGLLLVVYNESTDAPPSVPPA